LEEIDVKIEKSGRILIFDAKSQAVEPERGFRQDTFFFMAKADAPCH
jgi:hypothetical protein